MPFLDSKFKYFHLSLGIIILAIIVVVPILVSNVFCFSNCQSNSNSNSNSNNNSNVNPTGPNPRSAPPNYGSADNSSCECGYWDRTNRHLWTQSESVQFKNLSSLNNQSVFRISNRFASVGRGGTFNRWFQREQVSISSQGLEIRVSPVNASAIACGQLESRRADHLYGTFRARMLAPTIPGTCSAFYYYKDDINEIDVEAISALASNSNMPTVFMGIQSANLDTWYSKTYESEWTEYRFDWLPSSVKMFNNGAFVKSFEEKIPNLGGSVLFSHWSNGAPGWTQGPPIDTVTLIVESYTSYFNSSDQSLNDKCRTPLEFWTNPDDDAVAKRSKICYID